MAQGTEAPAERDANGMTRALHAEAMTPHGLALMAYFRGETGARLIVRRDDGLETALPVSHFFRSADRLSPFEVAALDRCRGRVLDIGAGSGLHALVLQSRGLDVTALDVSPHAVAVMVRRGVRQVQCGDVFDFHGGPFDTLLLLGHGIGLAGDLPGLERFLTHARALTRRDGQVLLDSVDVTRTNDPRHLAYHEANRRAGQYPGSIRLRFEYREHVGPCCAWLHVDYPTLGEYADRAGWVCAPVLEDESGQYLARLLRRPP
jgi:SAM-dependent methyltransferase